MKYLDLDQLSSLIYRRRRRQKVSQEQLASKMRIRRATFIRKEAEYSFTIQEIDRMADILKTTTSRLLEEKC